MVRALLAGTKTQTRRVVKFKPWHQIEERDDGTPWPWMYDSEYGGDCWIPCPYGQPGDRIWVREAWAWSGDGAVPAADRVRKGEVWFRADPERKQADDDDEEKHCRHDVCLPPHRQSQVATDHRTDRY